jgi:hypothetical protein
VFYFLLHIKGGIGTKCLAQEWPICDHFKVKLKHHPVFRLNIIDCFIAQNLSKFGAINAVKIWYKFAKYVKSIKFTHLLKIW